MQPTEINLVVTGWSAAQSRMNLLLPSSFHPLVVVWLSLWVFADIGISGPTEPAYFTIAATVGDLGKIINDEEKTLKQLASGEEVRGLTLQKRYERCGNKWVYDLFDPKLDLSCMNQRVTVKSYVGSPSGLVDDLNKLGVMIRNDTSGAIMGGILIPNTDYHTRIELHEFTGCVRELLLSALPKRYASVLWRLHPLAAGFPMEIQFGGPIGGTPKVSSEDFVPSRSNELKLSEPK
jgi:hypothetical protein